MLSVGVGGFAPALGAADLLLLLMRAGLIGAHEIVDRHISVIDRSRRHGSYAFVRQAGTSIFVKYGGDGERQATLGREADVYAFLEAVGHISAGTVTAVPKLITYDQANSLLVLEYFPDALTLQLLSQRRRRLPIRLARNLGAALAYVHSVTSGEHAQYMRTLARAIPWALTTLHRPTLATFQRVSRGNLEFIKLIQAFPELSRAIEDTERSWRSQCLIHGDLKWDNCIVTKLAASRRSRVRIIDWEFASWGDPLWDVGTVFSDYLTAWLRSAPISGETEPEEIFRLAQLRLPDLQRSAGAFWSTYSGCVFPGVCEGEALIRTMRYCAVRLLQHAFEHLQNQIRLTAQAVCAAQLAMNILSEPRSAAERLMGITDIRLAKYAFHATV
jgi:aminoglycoside phosphotransferase (APT) family kinase protein